LPKREHGARLWNLRDRESVPTDRGGNQGPGIFSEERPIKVNADLDTLGAVDA
jgi:hypothetical protein